MRCIPNWRNAVREYLVWATEDDRVQWLELVEGNHVELAPDSEGIVESKEFPGLRLDVVALLRRDATAVLAALQDG